MTSKFRDESVSLGELTDAQLSLFIHSQSMHLAALVKDRRLAPSEEAGQAVDEALDEFAALVDERSERERKSTVAARNNIGGAQS